MTKQTVKTNGNVIQCGRDYIAYIQHHVAERKWGIVSVNLFIFFFFFYGLIGASRQISNNVVTSQPINHNQAKSSTLPPFSVVASDPQTCVVRILSPLVSLQREPNYFSQRMVQVPPGDYTVLEQQVVNFVGINDYWLKIQANDRTGWVFDDVSTINNKSPACF
jgi:hypothetical protein